jgi:hypothetical protein
METIGGSYLAYGQLSRGNFIKQNTGQNMEKNILKYEYLI